LKSNQLKYNQHKKKEKKERERKKRGVFRPPNVADEELISIFIPSAAEVGKKEREVKLKKKRDAKSTHISSTI